MPPISETDARTILSSLPPGQAVLDQLEYGDLQIAQSRGNITNPPGFYISLLQRNVTPPATFETSQVRNARQQAEFAQREAIQKTQAVAEAQEEAERQKLDHLFAALPLQEQTDLERQVKAELKARYPSVNWMMALPCTKARSAPVSAACSKAGPCILFHSLHRPLQSSREQGRQCRQWSSQPLHHLRPCKCSPS